MRSASMFSPERTAHLVKSLKVTLLSTMLADQGIGEGLDPLCLAQ